MNPAPEDETAGPSAARPGTCGRPLEREDEELMCDESKVIDVLLVEDDEGDVLMTREAFEHYKIQNRAARVTDGEQALQFLRRTGPFADAPRPGLILLDVNLPRRSGLEVLAELKQDPELLDPGGHADHLAGRGGSCAATRCTPTRYVSKPVDFEHFIDAIRQIDNFFMTLVKLPTCCPSEPPSWPGHGSRAAAAGPRQP